MDRCSDIGIQIEFKSIDALQLSRANAEIQRGRAHPDRARKGTECGDARCGKKLRVVEHEERGVWSGVKYFRVRVNECTFK